MKWGWAWRGLTGYHGGLRESPNAEVLQITYLVSYYGFFTYQYLHAQRHWARVPAIQLRKYFFISQDDNGWQSGAIARLTSPFSSDWALVCSH